MQVSDLLVQYQNNLAAGSEISTGIKGIEQLVETARQLKVGNIFEGTINSIKGTQVILGLSSGQNITARLDGGISLSKGQSVFFQVKANDGEQVQIKPVSMGADSSNPTLMQALDAANLPVNEKNLNMVNAMMKEKMPIGAKSLQEMSRRILQVHGRDATTVVEMVKLDIPITESTLRQFENYKNDAHQVLKQIQQLAAELPLVARQAGVSVQESISYQQELIQFFSNGNKMDKTSEEKISDSVQQKELQNVVNIAEESEHLILSGEKLSEKNSGQTDNNMSFKGKENLNNTLGEVLPEKEFISLQQKITQMIEDFTDNTQEVKTNLFSQNKPVKEFLTQFLGLLQTNSDILTNEKITDFTKQKGYQKLLEHLITQEWSLEPEELRQEHSVRKLYQKMETQLQELQQLVAKYPKSCETVSQAANNLSQNIDFMNQINQTYMYVQVPIRLRGENTNTELFVYRNKQEEKQDSDSFSAFLHFDMEYLGGMDISVKMKKKNVRTNWYLDDQKTFAILSDNIHLLTEQLEKKGYHCDMKLEKNTNSVNFVEDFLKADAKSGGEVHRYSFDVRA